MLFSELENGTFAQALVSGKQNIPRY